MRPRIAAWLVDVTGMEAWRFLVPDLAVLMTLGFIAAAWEGLRHARREGGIGARDAATVAIFAWLGGLAGARLLTVLVHVPAWLRHPDQPHLLLHGGLTAWGGYLGGAGAFAWYLRRRGLDTWRLIDAAAPAMGIGTFFGRLGCFLSGCDFGIVTTVPWAVRFPAGSPAHAAHLRDGVIHAENFLSAPVHPTQLYSALYGLGLWLVFRYVVHPRRQYTGQVLCWYLVAFAVCRFWVETVRGDVDRGFVGPLSTSQAVGLAVIAGAVFAMRRFARGRHA